MSIAIMCRFCLCIKMPSEFPQRAFIFSFKGKAHCNVSGDEAFCDRRGAYSNTTPQPALTLRYNRIFSFFFCIFSSENASTMTSRVSTAPIMTPTIRLVLNISSANATQMIIAATSMIGKQNEAKLLFFTLM